MARQKSIASGRLRIVSAFEGSHAEQFYAVVIDNEERRRADGRYNLSCDCASWISDQSGRGGGPSRICKHTEATNRLLNGEQLQGARQATSRVPIENVIAMQPLLQPIEGATWKLQQVEARVPGLGASGSSSNYQIELLEVVTAEGQEASAFVAINTAHHHTTQRIGAAVAGYAGWAIAAELARLAGFLDVGPPPPRYKFESRGSGGRRGQGSPATTAQVVPAMRRVGLADLLNFGQETNLGDGLTPQQRAEHTLRLFLGGRYEVLQRQGYLDVPSRRYPNRVYRLRIDPDRETDKRIRVIENGNYVNDYCVVRSDWSQPHSDHFLGVFMRLLTNEQNVLAVVRQSNIFRPFSDSREPIGPLPMLTAA